MKTTLSCSADLQVCQVCADTAGLKACTTTIFSWGTILSW
jgi:hypothetical protein